MKKFHRTRCSRTLRTQDEDEDEDEDGVRSLRRCVPAAAGRGRHSRGPCFMRYVLTKLETGGSGRGELEFAQLQAFTAEKCGFDLRDIHLGFGGEMR